MMNKDHLLNLMNALDFSIHDIAVINGREMVAKKCQNGRVVWWNMEVEGSGFERLFKGSILNACKSEIWNG